VSLLRDSEWGGMDDPSETTKAGGNPMQPEGNKQRTIVKHMSHTMGFLLGLLFLLA